MFTSLFEISPTKYFWYLIAGSIILFIASYALPFLMFLGFTSLGIGVLWFVYNAYFLLGKRQFIQCERILPEILSLGDENTISITLHNQSKQKFNTSIIDELPFQFQNRSFKLETELNPGEFKTLKYQLNPTERGRYHFGRLNVFLALQVGLAKRHMRFELANEVKVYPSVLQMKRFQLSVLTRISRLEGSKKVRRMGQSYEFEQIRNYVQGDDFRFINWKATSRAQGALKMNQFEDEKSQAVYNIIDKSRNMKMPFNGLSLMDYSINSALVIANTALLKSDKSGLISFSEKVETGIQAENNPKQLKKILDALYFEKQSQFEANYEELYSFVGKRIKQRSLLFLYTNFETLHNLTRNLPIILKLNRRHVLVVIMFENSEIMDKMNQETHTIEDIYDEIIAEKFVYQKSLIAKELRKYGIKTILTRPEDLTINTVNSYLEIKSLGLI